MSNEGIQEFSKWRRRLWPFHRHELRKMLPLILMKFLVSVNYGILFCMKDPVIMSAVGGGAEVIAVLKGWVVLPAAILCTLLYSKLSNILSKQTLFYSFLGGFITVVALLGLFLYPNAETFSPHNSADMLTDYFAGRYTHWIAVYRNWIQSLMFITAELWGSMVILLMFWGFVNQVSNVKEAKKSYTIYVAAGDVAALLMGPLMFVMTSYLGGQSYHMTVQFLTCLVVLIGFVIMALYWWTNKNVISPADIEPQVTKKAKKRKPSLLESLRVIVRSKYLWYVATLVIAYGLSINIFEITWKAHVKMLYPNPMDQQSVMGTVLSLVGFTSLIASLFLCGSIIRVMGWHFTAQVPPIVLGLSGASFFSLIIFKKQVAAFLGFSTDAVMLTAIVLFGASLNVICKMVKYSFFDPTKEMAYIPMSEDEKVRGKAAVDVVGSRLGKSGSAWIQVALIDIMGTGSVIGIPHLLLPIVVVTVVFWIHSVYRLDGLFKDHQEEEAIIEDPMVQT